MPHFLYLNLYYKASKSARILLPFVASDGGPFSHRRVFLNQFSSQNHFEKTIILQVLSIILQVLF